VAPEADGPEDHDPGAGERKAEQEALETLKAMEIGDVIRAGHEALLRQLVAKSMAGTMSHQEAAILRNMLRDNGMILGVPHGGHSVHYPHSGPLSKPVDLPALEPPDYDN
jgi:hypothetical protein